MCCPSLHIPPYAWIGPCVIPSMAEDSAASVCRFESQEALYRANLVLNANGVPVLLDRYVTNNPANFELNYGTIDDFHAGLTGLLGAAPPPPTELFAAIEAEHTAAADSDASFEVHNYGTVTTSRTELFFVADPSEERMRRLGASTCV